MAHHKSAKKRIRQTEKRTLRNRALRSSTRTAIKKFRALLQEGNSETLKTAYPGVQKTIDKAVTKGIPIAGPQPVISPDWHLPWVELKRLSNCFSLMASVRLFFRQCIPSV